MDISDKLDSALKEQIFKIKNNLYLFLAFPLI